MLLGILMAGTSEARALGVANGLDPKVLSNIIAKSSGRNWATELYNPWPGVMDHAPASKGYAGGFAWRRAAPNRPAGVAGACLPVAVGGAQDLEDRGAVAGGGHCGAARQHTRDQRHPGV
ncbi:hypothetical protein G6F61_014191 [Rhizopus arrhizus]|nr:hypothetical protein G6F61_014191 [Rhizopus arrhizus]